MNAVFLLKKYWNFDSFRPIQGAIVNAVLEKKDVLALLPTGGGKSICFQVPALASEGICIVVCPLISLMKDQVENLRSRGISAAAVYSGLTSLEIHEIWRNLHQGFVKFLYISPERITQVSTLNRFKNLSVSLIAIDEAHCISQWGYDFRPAYLQLNILRQFFPSVPMIALTATATPKVRLDIVAKLKLKNTQIFTQTFERKNIQYIVDLQEDKTNKLLEIARAVAGTGIVYVRTRRETVVITQFLNRNGIATEFYHAGLTLKERNDRQYRWKNNETKVVVATNAFGMGIDKEDVRFVVHLDLPESIEAYYQEAGRAGRDGQKSYAILLLHSFDLVRFKEKIDDKFPTIDEIKSFYQRLFDYLHIPVGEGAYTTYTFDLIHFCRKMDIPLLKSLASFSVLSQQAFLTLNESVALPAKIQFLASVEEVYAAQEDYPTIRPLIKVFLRTMTHVFEQPSAFSENEIAQKAQISVDTLKKQLLFLSEKGIIRYSSPTEEPLLEILKNRVAVSHLQLNYEWYEHRKTNILYQMNEMLNYAQSKSCRSVFLRTYLGEIAAQTCGQCDDCIEEKRKKKPFRRALQLEQNILILFKEQQFVDLQTLLKSLKDYSKAEVVTQLRILIDAEKLKLNPDFIL